MDMRDYLEILNLVTEAMLIAEDGKIDEAEEDRIAELIAPKLAELYEKEGKPVEEWAIVRLLVKIAQRTIKEIQKEELTEI